MGYIFYFLGFITFYRLSEYFAEGDDTPMWFHLVIGTIWPVISVLALLTDIYDAITGKDDEE